MPDQEDGSATPMRHLVIDVVLRPIEVRDPAYRADECRVRVRSFRPRDGDQVDVALTTERSVNADGVAVFASYGANVVDDTS